MKITSVEKSGKVIFAKVTELKLKVEGKDTVRKDYTEKNVPLKVQAKLTEKDMKKVKEEKEKGIKGKNK